MDTTFTIGWTVDIASIHDGAEKLIYRDCALSMLVTASQLFEDLAREHCSRPLAYGEETRIKYLLPRGVAAAAFIRILEWIRAIADISAHGDIEDPQITTFEDDGLTQYLRLLQAANLLKLKYPYHNQKRLPDMIKANIKKAFDTKNNNFQNVAITDREIGLIWDTGKGDRNDPIIKLLLALFVDAYDIRRENPRKYKDDILTRFDNLVEKNADFRSAVIDVKTKKEVRLREEERERKGLPKGATPQRRGRSESGRRSKNWSSNGARKGSQKAANHEDAEQWRSQELTQSQVEALMRRPEEFQIAYGNGG
jgi:hypothetical protein